MIQHNIVRFGTLGFNLLVLISLISLKLGCRSPREVSLLFAIAESLRLKFNSSATLVEPGSYKIFSPNLSILYCMQIAQLIVLYAPSAEAAKCKT